MKLTKDHLRYAVGAVVGVAVYASIQFALNRQPEFEVKPVTLDTSDVHLSPQAQLVHSMADGQAFAEKLMLNAVPVNMQRDVLLQYQGGAVWGCNVRVGYRGGYTTTNAKADSPERACVQAVLSLNKSGAL